MRLFTIAIIFFIAAAILVSGCTGNDPGTSATSTAQPGTATPASTQAAGGSDQPKEISLLFNSNGLQAYKYRINQTTHGFTEIHTFEINYTDETYHGVAARHTMTTSNIPALGGGNLGYEITDIYTSKADNSPLGGHNKLVRNGKVMIDQDMRPGEADVNMSHDMVKSIGSLAAVTLINEGPDTITIDGKTYACTKYKMAELNETIWYYPQAPMPVKDLFTAGKNYTQVIELLSWS